MNEQLKQLWDLQAIDLESDQLQDNVHRLRAKLEEAEAFLKTLSTDLEGQKEQLADTRRLHTSKRLEIAETESRLNEAKNKFHSVTNSREYAAAEREVEGFKKVLAQLEEETAQLGAAIEEAAASIAEKESKIDELRNELVDEQTAVQRAAAETEARAAELKKKHLELAKGIRPDVLGRYRFIRSRRPGKAIVAAVDGACTGCFMRLPPQAFIELQRGTTMSSCQNCNRILYYATTDEQTSSGPAVSQ